MITINYGGGTNSAGLVCGWVERGDAPPDAVVFADTGGERPEVYEHVALMSAWLKGRGWPEIVTVRATFEGRPYSLEEHCHRSGTMPSIAYGRKSCSQKFKAAPVDRYLSTHPAATEAWARGEKVTKVLGIDADEDHRAKPWPDDKKYTPRYPLIEWGWGREECVAAIARAGLPSPGKSACFFCPSAKVQEIKALSPDLRRRALAIEDAARATMHGSIKGLGRSFSWRRLLEFGDIQGDLFTVDVACGCVDD